MDSKYLKHGVKITYSSSMDKADQRHKRVTAGYFSGGVQDTRM